MLVFLQDTFMTKINQSLYGLWEMTAMRFQDGAENWESEPIFGGTSMFTQSGQILTFTRAEIAFGYSGTFVIDGDELVITPQVCSIPELEKTRFVRTVKTLTSDALTLMMTDSATGRRYEIDFRLISRSF
jgi:hypothetical protein